MFMGMTNSSPEMPPAPDAPAQNVLGRGGLVALLAIVGTIVCFRSVGQWDLLFWLCRGMLAVFVLALIALNRGRNIAGAILAIYLSALPAAVGIFVIAGDIFGAFSVWAVSLPFPRRY